MLDHGGHWFSCQFHPEARKESWDCYYAGQEPDYVSAYTEQHDGARLMANFFRFSAEPREQVGLA